MTIKAMKRACLEYPIGSYLEDRYSGKSDKLMVSNSLVWKFDLCSELSLHKGFASLIELIFRGK